MPTCLKDYGVIWLLLLSKLSTGLKGGSQFDFFPFAFCQLISKFALDASYGEKSGIFKMSMPRKISSASFDFKMELKTMRAKMSQRRRERMMQ